MTGILLIVLRLPNVLGELPGLLPLSDDRPGSGGKGTRMDNGLRASGIVGRDSETRMDNGLRASGIVGRDSGTRMDNGLRSCSAVRIGL